MTDTPVADTVVLRWSPKGRADRRTIFLADASDGYTRLTQARSDTDRRTWRTVETTRVTDVTVYAP